MFRSLLYGVIFGALAALPAKGADAPRPNGKPKQAPPLIAQLIRGTADDFIRRFDRNHDGVITRDELPPRLGKLFDRADFNGDGKLDRKEIELLLGQLRIYYGIEEKTKAANPEAERLVDRMLRQMDKNGDGRISREEARGPLKEHFDGIDTNQDGYLDRGELLRAAERMIARRKETPSRKEATMAQAREEFDRLDSNADGRLTRDELRNTPYANVFDEIDTNHDGRIDPKEFAAYLLKREGGQPSATGGSGGATSKRP